MDFYLGIDAYEVTWQTLGNEFLFDLNCLFDDVLNKLRA